MRNLGKSAFKNWVLPNAEIRCLVCSKLVEFWGRDSAILGTDYLAAMCFGLSTIPSWPAHLQTDKFTKPLERVVQKLM